MKKVLMATLLVAVFAGLAMAQTTGDVNVSVAVNGLWQVTLDNYTVDFGAMNVNDNATDVVVATVRTNQKVAWYLKLNKDQDLTNTVAGETIPSANFVYAGSGGTGVWANGAGVNGVFPSSATAAYTASVAEQKAASGVALTTTYDLTIPAEAVAGTYTNTITYTLTATP